MILPLTIPQLWRRQFWSEATNIWNEEARCFHVTPGRRQSGCRCAGRSLGLGQKQLGEHFNSAPYWEAGRLGEKLPFLSPSFFSCQMGIAVFNIKVCWLNEELSTQHLILCPLLLVLVNISPHYLHQRLSTEIWEKGKAYHNDLSFNPCTSIPQLLSCLEEDIQMCSPPTSTSRPWKSWLCTPVSLMVFFVRSASSPRSQTCWVPTPGMNACLGCSVLSPGSALASGEDSVGVGVGWVVMGSGWGKGERPGKESIGIWRLMWFSLSNAKSFVLWL